METVQLSSVNLTYLNSLKKEESLPPVEERDNTVLSDKQKAKLVGAVALGTIAVCGLVAFGRYKDAQKLAEKIDFIPAQTLEEAREFAKKHLKITDFKLTDLSCANYVNEALVNFNNTSSTHRRIVSSVVPETIDSAFAAITYRKGIIGRELSINEKFFREIDSEVLDMFNTDRSFLTSKTVPDSLKDTLSSFLADHSSISVNDKVSLCNAMGDYITLGLGGTPALFNNLIVKENVAEFLKSSSLPSTLDEFGKLTHDEQMKVLKQIIRHTGEYPVCNFDGPFHQIFHEIGHALHCDNIGNKKFAEYAWHTADNVDKLDVSKAFERFKTEVGSDSLAYAIRGNVSVYAATSPAEFVAETFAKLKTGVKFSDDIMEIYKKFGGVMP